MLPASDNYDLSGFLFTGMLPSPVSQSYRHVRSGPPPLARLTLCDEALAFATYSIPVAARVVWFSSFEWQQRETTRLLRDPLMARCILSNLR